MLLLELSEPGRPLLLTSAAIPDLTDKIVRSDDQYCEAGGFGDVFRCRCKSDDDVKEVAVKAFRFNFTVDEHKRDGGKLARMIRRELGIWKRLSHRNVVPFLGIAYGFGRQGSASLVSMWMPHGTVHTFLEAHGNRLVVAHRLQLLLDIANGLQYLHSFPLVHGDLSSNNVLLDHNYNARLTDFGCASLVGEIPEGFTYLEMSTKRPGTLRWAAPEHFSLNEGDTKHTIKSDIYSFGNMALLVLSGKYPWSEIRVDAAVVLHLSQGLKPDRPVAPPIDDRHWALIDRCWLTIPEERPLAEDVMSSLQQLLRAHSLPMPLRDLLDAAIPSYNVPNCPGNDDDPDDDVTPIESPLERPRSPMPTGTSPSAPPPVPEDITRRPDLSTSSAEQVRALPSSEWKDTEEKNIAKESGEDIRIHGLVASGIPTYLNEDQVQALFQNFGELKRFRFVREDSSGPSKGIALFEYVDVSVTDTAVRGLDGMELGDCYIVVRREGTAFSNSDADEAHRPPLTKWKVGDNAKRNEVTPADRDDVQKRPEYARAGHSYSSRGLGHSYVNPSGPDSKERPERARTGHLYIGRAEEGSSYSNSSAPTTRPQHGFRAEEPVSQKRPTAGKRITHPPSDGSLPFSKWVRGALLGAGTYGLVYLALHPSTGEMVAVKQVRKDNKAGQRLNFVPELKVEQKILSGLDHPHIIGYLGFEETTTFLGLLLEYVPGGTIASCLREYGRFHEDVVKLFTSQMLDGLAYLHANHIIHRNIETNNILVDPSGICKISGFGNAQCADDDHASWTPMRGTVLWSAPEMIKNRGEKRYGNKVDIWSGGCVLLKMWVGGRPSDGDVFASMVMATRQGTSPSLPFLPDLAVDFSDRCFAIDPEARASATELIRHPYLTLAPDWVFTGFT